MKKFVVKFVFLFILLILFPRVVDAHPGRTDSNGCHYCRTNCDSWGVAWNVKHCHGGNTTTKKVTTKVTKTYVKSSNANIKSLKVDGEIVNGNYSFIYKTYKNSATIKVSLEDSKAKVKGTGTKQLNDYKNEFEIIVTAENGDKENYNVIIYKVNDNNYLKHLGVEGYELSPSFSRDIEEYEIEVGSEITNIVILSESEDYNSKIEIEGNKNLIAGVNDVNIKVTSTSDIEKIYKIKVQKQEKISDDRSEDSETNQNNNGGWGLLTLSLGGIGYFLWRKLKK